MKSGRWYAAVALAGIAVAVLMPLSPGLSSDAARQARFIGAILTLVICSAFGLSRSRDPPPGQRFRSFLPSQR